MENTPSCFLSIWKFVFCFLCICLVLSPKLLIGVLYLETNNNTNPPEKIDCFSVFGTNGQKDLKDLINFKHSLLIIISEGCKPCNQNIPIWNKMSKLTNINTYGIVLNMQKNSDALSFEGNLIHFPIFFPLEESKFLNNLKLDYETDCTILCENDLIVFKKTGQITIEDYFILKRHINGGTNE